MATKPELQKISTLSPMQEGMLFHYLMNQDKPQATYFEQTVFTICGGIDYALFEKSFALLVERHEVFRTNFIYQKIKSPRQVILKERKAELLYEDISGFDEGQKISYLKDFKQRDREKGFDLTKDPLVRVSILKTGPEAYQLIWSFHHILMDGWCIGIILKDFFQIYQSFKFNTLLKLESTPSFGSYLEWLELQDKGRALEYWEVYLRDYETQAKIPYQKTAMDGDYRQEEQLFFWDEKTTQTLADISVKHQVTLNAILQSLWGILLQKYNRVNDVVFGAVVSGRSPEVPGIEKMVGLFINTIPIRVKTDPGQTFAGLVKKVHQDMLAAEKYSYFQLAEIQSHTLLKTDLISHIMAFENYPLASELAGASAANDLGFKVTGAEVFEQANYPFGIIIALDKKLSILLKYNSLVYSPDQLSLIGGHLTEIARQITSNPDTPINALEVLTVEERRQLVDDFNATGISYPGEKTITDLFEEQTARTPDNIAVVFENQQLSYSELNRKANYLANTLRRQGIKPGTVAAIISESSLEMIIGIFGILKAGGAFLPVNPELPVEQTKFILENSEARIVLTWNYFQDLSQWNFQGMELQEAQTISGEDPNPPKVNQACDLAYIIYTSGTAGNPKGVMIEHGSIANTIQWRRDEYQLDGRDHVLQLCSYSFDGFIVSFFTPITSGAKAILLSENQMKDPTYIRNIIALEQVTHFACVPSLFREILEVLTPGDAQTLRIITLAGENASPDLISKSKAINPALEMVNEYGPTENSVTTTIKRDLETSPSITIGKPIANTDVLILDQNRMLQPVGVAGELCISGRGLARGYLKQPELTASKFITNPYRLNQRMYCTGDLARWLPSGEIELIGRIDDQVKIRGFRIEMDGIEALLLKYEGVNRAIVIARESENGAKYLCAYLTADREMTVRELRDYLAKNLPDYMIPSYFVQLENMPLTTSGKIDRKRLPKPEGRMNTGTEYVAPENKVEQRLAAAWTELLKCERVGIHDNFFEIGGNSIMVVRLHMMLEPQYPNRLKVVDFFTYPTIFKLAQYLQSQLELENKPPAPQRKTLKTGDLTRELNEMFDALEQGKINTGQFIDKLTGGEKR
ncbi:MAG TPA: amino acid adenylation domain-containing protein [Bacillota bacterium]|nr:amino acid adenylation domain-containing protein [Bacillota bacterium]